MLTVQDGYRHVDRTDQRVQLLPRDEEIDQREMDAIHGGNFRVYLQCKSNGLLRHPTTHLDQKGIPACIHSGTDRRHHLACTQPHPYCLLWVHSQ